MKPNYTTLAGGLTLALTLAHPALAARGQPSYYVPPSFGDLDEDRNGSLDQGEVQGRSPLYGLWERFDANRDGLIEPSEFAAFESYQASLGQTQPQAALSPERGAHAGRHSGHAANASGRGAHPSFAQLDIDGNGVLSEGEAGGAKGLLDYWDEDHGQAGNAMDRSEFAAFESSGPMSSGLLPEPRR
jgi:hypothetical protein